jgi:hypothetical protein
MDPRSISEFIFDPIQSNDGIISKITMNRKDWLQLMKNASKNGDESLDLVKNWIALNTGFVATLFNASIFVHSSIQLHHYIITVEKDKNEADILFCLSSNSWKATWKADLVCDESICVIRHVQNS